MFTIARALFVVAALVALVLTFQGMRHRRRGYLQAALAILAVLAIGLTAVLGVGLRQPGAPAISGTSPEARDAALALRSVHPTAFDSVADCLVQLRALEAFYALYPDRYADPLQASRALRAELGDGTAANTRHCSDLPALRNAVAEGHARLRAASGRPAP